MFNPKKELRHDFRDTEISQHMATQVDEFRDRISWPEVKAHGSIGLLAG